MLDVTYEKWMAAEAGTRHSPSGSMGCSRWSRGIREHIGTGELCLLGWCRKAERKNGVNGGGVRGV